MPGASGTGLLKSLVDRGVKVRVLTNSLAATDVPLVHAGYAKYRPALLKHGVTLYELKPTAVPDIGAGPKETSPQPGSEASLHAKIVSVKRTVLIGSMNFDPRSAWYHIDSERDRNPELAAQVAGVRSSHASDPVKIASTRMAWPAWAI